MSGLIRTTGGALAAILSVLIVSIAVVVVSATMIGERLVAMQTSQAESVTAPVVNRERKSDALPFVPAVSGMSSNELRLQSDEAANRTIATKDNGARIERDAESIESEESANPSKQLHGCESAFARPAPESLTRRTSRCMTELAPHATKFAALH